MSNAVQVLSAGSLRHAFPAIIGAFGHEYGIGISLTLGPAGLLRETIEEGASFDLFASANMAHPQRLVSMGLAENAVCFARNRLCVLSRADLGLTTENFLAVLSDPAVGIGTSTPGDDPGGDYAFEVFDRIEARHPGKGEAIKSRSRQLVGGRNSPPAPPGKGGGYLIADGVVDLMMSYSSNARLLAGDPAFLVSSISPTSFSRLLNTAWQSEGTRMTKPNIYESFCCRRPGRKFSAKPAFLRSADLQHARIGDQLLGGALERR